MAIVRGHIRKTRGGATAVRPHKRRESFKEVFKVGDSVKTTGMGVPVEGDIVEVSDERPEVHVEWATGQNSWINPVNLVRQKKESFKEAKMDRTPDNIIDKLIYSGMTEDEADITLYDYYAKKPSAIRKVNAALKD